MDAPISTHGGQVFGRGFRLEALRIEPATGDVSGPGGREKLDPKVMGVLVLMAGRAGQVVSREDLHDQLWPNAVVTDDALTRCVHELRRQLSLAGGDERYRTLIETLPKRGYQLHGVVSPLEPAVTTALRTRSRRAWLAAAGAVIAIAVIVFVTIRRDAESPAAGTDRSIAVLPFVDMSEARDQGYFADGIAEEILSRLAKAGGLRVISRQSSFSFRGEEQDVAGIAGRLGVTHVLEGTVRRSGDGIRITVQLIAASNQSHLWSETYDRQVGDLFAVQDEIAQAVAESLRVTLSPAAREKPPANPAAYERYLAGRLFRNRRGPGDLQRAVRALEDAVELDPTYAAAWAELAGTYMLLTSDGAFSWDDGRARQRAAAEEAIRLDPSAPDGYERLAQYYFAAGDLDRARAQHDKARLLLPTGGERNAAASEFTHTHEDLAAAIDRSRRDLEHDPLSAGSYQNLGLALFAAGRLEEARLAFAKAHDLSPDLELDANGEIARVLIAERTFDEARAAAAQFRVERQRDYVLALLVESPGHRAEADAALARLAALEATDQMHCIRLAEAYVMRGRKQEAFAVLGKFPESLDAGDPRRFFALWWYREEVGLAPFLAPLHSDPRWQALMAEG